MPLLIRNILELEGDYSLKGVNWCISLMPKICSDRTNTKQNNDLYHMLLTILDSDFAVTFSIASVLYYVSSSVPFFHNHASKIKCIKTCSVQGYVMPPDLHILLREFTWIIRNTCLKCSEKTLMPTPTPNCQVDKGGNQQLLFICKQF